MNFSPDLVDPSRLSRALEAVMTPLKVEEGTGSFASSEGEIYYANTEECSCPDFRFNQRMAKPCKHMIRMAMIAGLYPSDNMQNDPKEAYALYYAGTLEHYLKYEPLAYCLSAIRILNALVKPGIRPEDDDVLSFAGVPKLTESGMTVVKEKSGKIVINPSKKKTVKSLTSTLSKRIGEFIIDNIDRPEVLDFFGKITAEDDSEKQENVT